MPRSLAGRERQKAAMRRYWRQKHAAQTAEKQPAATSADMQRPRHAAPADTPKAVVTVTLVVKVHTFRQLADITRIADVGSVEILHA